jgi:hypothetical protein
VRHDHGRSSGTAWSPRYRAGWSRRVAAVVVAIACTVAIVAYAAPAHGAELRRALLVGDSVSVGATPAIQAAGFEHGWSVSIDAEIGRTTSQGADILASMQGRLPSVVVIELGNNDAAIPASFATHIDAVMRELAGADHVVWYTMSRFASWVPAANAELQAATDRWPNLELADWSTVAATTPGVLSGSGPHLMPAGGDAFSDLLFSTINGFDDRTPVVTPVAVRAQPILPLFESFPHSLHAPRAPMIGLNATPWATGLSLVAADGGVFTYGDARFYGSMGASRLSHPIVEVRSTESGRGYWLTTSDGGVFAFGDARFCGAAGATPRPELITGESEPPRGIT